MWPFRKRRDELDPRSLMVPMRPAKIGLEGYTADDRLHDFRAVLVDANATPDQAERVLFQILTMTGVHDPFTHVTMDDSLLNRLVGRREIGLELLAALTVSKQGVLSPTTQHSDGGE